MTPKFLTAIEVVLKHEGGYVNHPSDPGGETKYGITKRTYPEIDIKSLTKERAVEIYHRDWWVKYRYDQIDSVSVATKVFDLAVNMGPANGHRILQRSSNFLGAKLTVDGVLGPLTFGAVNSLDPEKLHKVMRYKAAEYYFALAKRRVESRAFLMGWLNRAYAEV